MNGVIATSVDVKTELHNAQVADSLGDYYYLLARVDAARVLRSAIADDDQKAEAQRIFDHAAAILQSMPPFTHLRAAPQQTPGCEAQGTVWEPAAADFPDAARNLGLPTMVAFVQVSIDEKGVATDAVIKRTSGNADVDQSAEVAALESRYIAARSNCQPVPSTYVFRVEYEP